MGSARVLAALLFVASLTDDASQAKGWRGIIPLRSARSDVERLLGAPIRPGFASLYDTSKAKVSVFYSQGPCTEGKGGWKVPLDTVINIAVLPRGRLLVSDIKQIADLSLDGRGFTRAPDPRVPGSVNYFNDEAGVDVSTWESADGEHVQIINFGPTANDRH
ncbi:MAG: hypothetical protein LC800_10115, partial [Acidobacteria bacterium]|nr:hypothetical protein [Acidobacteriota bacterium]